MKDGLPVQETSAMKAKEARMKELFEKVAPSYDSVTALVSLGLDRRWRRKAVGYLAELMDRRRANVLEILDACCGTGEMTLELASAFPKATLTGIDFSSGMIERAKRKVQRSGVRGAKGGQPAPAPYTRIAFLQADMNRLPFADKRFDIVTVAFGLRNSVSHLQSLGELRRVLKPGGVLSVLDCFTPRRSIANSIFRFYFHNFIPFVGGLVKSRRQYAHLPASIEKFGTVSDIEGLLRNNGFAEVIIQPVFRDLVCHFIAT
ncbi:MAG: ubiquinone/menaquinone biosynthesis methyltransferase, partial [Bacillota bacterium]